MSTILIDLIREQILSETPLMDIIPFKNKRDNLQWTNSNAPSIGYNLPSKLKGTEKEKRNHQSITQKKKSSFSKFTKPSFQHKIRIPL